MKSLKLLQRQPSHSTTDRGCSSDQAVDEPKKFKFKLIAIIGGESMLSSAELNKHVYTRKRNKPLVTVILCKKHIQLLCKKTEKTKNKMLKTDFFSPMDNVIGTFQFDSEPRAVGFTIYHSPHRYISVILISKKCCFFRKKKIEETFADILVNKIKAAQKLIQTAKTGVTPSPPVSSKCIPDSTELQLQCDDSNSAVESASKVCYAVNTASLQHESTTYNTDSNNPLAWPIDIFASDRRELQNNQILHSPVNNICISESKSNFLQSAFPCLKRQQCNNETSGSKAYHQTEKHLSDLSAALDSAFVNSEYVPLSNSHLFQQGYKFSDEVFNQESGLLQYMNMLVPLKSKEAAVCSRTNIFEYIPLHVRDPSLDEVSACEDFKIPSPQLKDLNDSSVPEHVRKGIKYDKSDLICFSPEYESTNEDHSDNIWFSGEVDTALVVGYTWNNGLQHFPTVPNASFIHRMEKLFNAYLNPKMYHERDLGVTNNPEKLARFLSSTDYPGIEKLRILSYRDPKLSHCWFFPPSCARDPDLNLVLD